MGNAVRSCCDFFDNICFETFLLEGKKCNVEYFNFNTLSKQFRYVLSVVAAKLILSILLDRSNLAPV